MIRVRLINEGKVVKQITSRLHESVVLAQIEKYKDPFDSVQVVEGELSEDAKDMLHRVAKKIIPAAMAAGVALGGAGNAQAQGGANPNYPGLNYSIGDHVRDIVSPNYRERVRQREHQRSTERQVWDAEQNEIRKQRIQAARARAQQHAAQNQVYDQARNSGDGKFIIIYGMDDRVTRIPAKGTEFMPADSQRMAHYITPNGRVYYVRHPHTAGIAQAISKESVTEAGTIGTVGTIPASGATSMTQKTKFAPTGKTTDVQVNDRGELELADPDALDPMTKQKMAKAGLKVAEALDSLDQIIQKHAAAVEQFKKTGYIEDENLAADLHYYFYDQLSPQAQRDADDEGELETLFADELGIDLASLYEEGTTDKKDAVQNKFNHKPDDWSEDFERRMKQGVDEGGEYTPPVAPSADPLNSNGTTAKKAKAKQMFLAKKDAFLKKQKEKEQGVDEGYLDNPGKEDSPVAQAIVRRILLQRTDLLAKHGPEKVMAAIDEVADWVGDVDEIGSSDVSAWIKQVERTLGQVEEAAPALAKAAAGLGLGALAAAGAPAIVGVLGPLLGIPMAAYGAYSAAKLGMQGVEKLWDMAADKLGGDDKVAQYATAKIAKLPPEQQQAAAGVIKQLGESRRKIAEAEHGLDAILDQYAENWAKFKAGGDLDENPDFYEALFNYYADSGEMPYGTQKARTGDPVEWLTMKMDAVAGNDPVAEAEDDEASAADQAAADKNIIMQIRRAADYEKPTQLELGDGTRVMIDAHTARALLAQFDKLRPDSKMLMQQALNTFKGFDELSKHFGGSIRKEAITRVGKIMADAFKESRKGRV